MIQKLSPRIASRLDRWPLRSRLIAIIAGLLALGLAIAALLTQQFVEHFLTEQIDSQLSRGATDLGPYSMSTPPPDAADAVSSPSDYVVLTVRATGETQLLAWPATLARYGTPLFPELSADEFTELAGQPFTVAAEGGNIPTEWRVVVEAGRRGETGYGRPRPGGGRDSAVFVALPLAGVRQTSLMLARTLWGIAAAIVLVGALASYLLVRRALRPLGEIEATAAAIAGGDLTRRVPVTAPNTEVGSLGVSLNTMLTQIEHAFAEQAASEARMRQFVSDASHELRTPLATIRGYSELYRMGAVATPAEVGDTVGRIEDAAIRMGSLVEDLLVLARLDEGRPLQRSRVDISAMLHDAAQDLRALDPTRLVTCDAEVGVQVLGDAERLRQVLTNLVGNVARYTPVGSPVELVLSQAEGFAQIFIIDHGPGVDPTHAVRLFERFYRVETSRSRDAGGSGLGLAIVAAITGAHGGKVDLAPTDGGGLTVRLSLPLA